MITNLIDFHQHHSNQIIIPHGLCTSYCNAPHRALGGTHGPRTFLSDHADHVIDSFFLSPDMPSSPLFDGICLYLYPMVPGTGNAVG